MLNVEEFIGMSERSAVRKIENARFVARVLSRDGNERVRATADYHDCRINLIVNDGLVTKAWIG